MRDIRPDLQERLAAADAAKTALVAEYEREESRLRASFQDRFKRFDAEITAAQQLLSFENARHGGEQPQARTEPKLPLDVYLERALTARPLSKDDLRQMAQDTGILLRWRERWPRSSRDADEHGPRQPT